MMSTGRPPRREPFCPGTAPPRPPFRRKKGDRTSPAVGRQPVAWQDSWDWTVQL